jgi:hypothetical protein
VQPPISVENAVRTCPPGLFIGNPRTHDADQFGDTAHDATVVQFDALDGIALPELPLALLETTPGALRDDTKLGVIGLESAMDHARRSTDQLPLVTLHVAAGVVRTQRPPR